MADCECPHGCTSGNVSAGEHPVLCRHCRSHDAAGERLRRVYEQARFVSQWYGAIGSGPIGELDFELGELWRLTHAADEVAVERPSRADYPEEGSVPTSVQNAWNEGAER